MANESQLTTLVNSQSFGPPKQDSSDEDSDELILFRKWEFQMRRLTKVTRQMVRLESRMVQLEEKLLDIESMEIELTMERLGDNVKA